ncbi:MAG: type I DNA topoisomerase [Chloroflexi bacterium]|nr:type I DNA topoisomerase [Chloroflexota bacterium]
MTKDLVVVESPAKARTMGRILGAAYEVKASLGHVRDLPEDQLGVQVDDGFSPSYVVLKEKRKVLQELKAASRQAPTVYLATDPDREGEAISWHLVQAAGWQRRPTRRVVFHQITEDAILEAFRHPREIDMKLVNAQQARRILDRLVGYQLSPLLWRKVQRGLSAGRVQSVALRLVVDREREIEAFVAREYWVIQATLEPLGVPTGGGSVQPFVATLQGIRGERGKLDLPTGEAARQVLAALEGAAYRVEEVVRKEVRSRPAPPFITSTLQQEAWRKLRFPAKKTMAVAQQLYEGLVLGAGGSVGLITYMRTDSTHVAPSAAREALEYIRATFGEAYAPRTPRTYTRKVKGAQEAHEAIRPTAVPRTPEAVRPYLATDQLQLYTLVWKRMVASQMTDAVSDATRVDMDATGPQAQGRRYWFRATGAVLRFPGFRAVYREDRDEPSEDEQQRPLPELSPGQDLRCLGVDADQRFTQPLPRYTEATLIRALEEQGIGRPSTYAPTLSVILERSYVIKEQGRFKPTQLGKVVTDLLTAHFPRIMDVGFTATMEEHLDEIARGEEEWVPVLRDFYGPFQEALGVALTHMPRVKVEEPSDEVCDLCSRPMVVKTYRSKRGGRVRQFLSCTGFPQCRGAKPIIKRTGIACPTCHTGGLVERWGRGRTFYGCSNYPECKFAVGQRPLREACPQCGGLLVAAGRGGARCVACRYRGAVPQGEPAEVEA